MYKLLIVDDEALARYSIITLISRNFSEIEVVGEAENGRQAIALNEKNRPDIIIMDIKIPGINGIDASYEILKDYPSVNILILTAYDNFDYIQKALDIGVKGYLLKPVRKEDFVEKINKIINIIESGTNTKLTKENIEKKMRTVKPVLEKEIVTSILKPQVNIKETKEYINFLQFDFEAGYFMIFSVLQDTENSISDSIRNKINKDKVYEFLYNNLPLMRQCLFGHTIGNMIVVFFPFEKDINPEKCRKESKIIANEMIRKIKLVRNLDIACGIGSLYLNLEELRKSFEEARQSVSNSIKTGKCIHFKELNVSLQETDFEYPIQKERELINSIRSGNIEKISETYREVSSLIFNNRFEYEAIREYLMQLLAIIKRTMLEMGIGSLKVISLGGIAETKNFMKEEDLKYWFEMVINTITGIIFEFKESKENVMVTKMYSFINSNFTENISLDTLAEEFSLSTQYISKIFKDEYGKNFIDYLTEKRIDFAKELFRDKNISIKEVSKKVGYEDPNYFCRIFKKNTGQTPKDYKNRKIGR